MHYTLAELTKDLDVTIKGDPDCLIAGVSPIQSAKPGHISFLTNPRYRKHLEDTEAAAVILSQKDAPQCRVNAIISSNPYYTYAKIAEKFLQSPLYQAGIHPSAVIGEHCQIDRSATICAHVVIGQRVTIAKNVVVGPSCVIGDDVMISENAILDANVTLYYDVKIGKRTHLSSGVVVGGDGFGFANEKGKWHKVPQLGSVVIGDDVDVGANTAIDRGAIENTVIENDVKLDNLIQVGHNVTIGEGTVIAGTAAIAGSTTIGKYCMIGGAACFAGHITIADKVMVTGMTTVTKSITEPGVYSSGIIGAVPNQEFRKNNARFHRLGTLMDRIKDLEIAIKALTEREQS